jgi:putative transcriptional regulator
MGELTGRLVVASHDLTDGSFHRSVVLVLAHDPNAGAAGIMLNRPGPAELPGRLAPWTPLLSPPQVMFRGGPVGPDTVIGLGVGDDVDVPGWQPVRPGIVVVDLTGDIELTRTQVRAIRLFVGYAGWTAEQLEDEISAGTWFVVDAEPADVCTAEPTGLWRAVLARQGGVFTTVPDDPSMN